MSITPRMESLLELLTDVAERGEVCPRNSEIAESLATPSFHNVSSWMTSLERSGLILVDRIGWERIVTIVSTGKSTGEPPTQRMMRERQDRGIRNTAKNTFDRETIIVSRDPCRRCGVRGDIGCEHQTPVPPMALSDRGRVHV